MKTIRNIFFTAKERRERKRATPLFLRSLRFFAVSTLFVCSSVFAEEFPDIETYNRACELYRQKDFQEAEVLFGKTAVQTEEEELKQKALYNQGTTLLAGTTVAQTNDTLPVIVQAVDLLELAVELDPTDLDTKQNLERAINLGVTGHVRRAEQLMDAADQMLAEFQASAAKTNYLSAIKILTPVFDDLAPGHKEAAALKERANQQLQMLDHAIAETKEDLTNARHAIDVYEYKLAADVLLANKPSRRWAFDLDKDLAQKFQQFTKNNRKVIEIVYPNHLEKP